MQNALRKLFYRIDANCDGTVDWDEFSLYMLLEQQGAAEIMESEKRRELKPPTTIAKVSSCEAHSKIIDCCTLIPPCGGFGSRYATGARDGTVKFWSPEVGMLAIS
jgi:WD40 repeat protein